jgi:hypothetical protein
MPCQLMYLDHAGLHVAKGGGRHVIPFATDLPTDARVSGPPTCDGTTVSVPYDEADGTSAALAVPRSVIEAAVPVALGGTAT